MSNSDALLILYSAVAQPLLIRWVVKLYGDSKAHRGEKIFCIVALSVIAGLVAYILEYGQGPINYAEIGQTILTIFALSVSFWSTAWKRVFPYEKDPAEHIHIDNLPK